MIFAHRMTYFRQDDDTPTNIATHWVWFARHTLYVAGLPVVSWVRVVRMEVI